MYLTYEEYTDMGGQLDETTFIRLEFDASTYIDYYTFDRLKEFDEIPYEVKMCIFNLFDYIQQVNSLGGTLTNEASGTVASMSNDGVSISYNVLNSQDLLTASKSAIPNIIKRYLSNVKDKRGYSILYRGVYY